MGNRDYLEKLIIRNKPVQCDRCNGKIFYIGNGQYQCKFCGHETLDDIGKLNQYAAENALESAPVVSQITGVDPEIVEMYFLLGKIEIPEGSKYYLKCRKCGCSIRYGNFCPSCTYEIVGGIKALFKEDSKKK